MNSPLQPIAPDVTPIIMHLEHTGGTTLKPIIERQYRKLYAITPFKQYTPGYYMQLPEAERASYDAIWGHLFWGIHRHVPGKSRYVTMLRHPLDRILSSYSYMGQRWRRKDHRAYAEGEVSWEQHLAERRDDIRQLTRIIGGEDSQIGGRRNDVLPDNYNEVAVAHLENDFALVGLQERYDETLIMMRYVLNWPKPIRYVRLNTSKKRIRLADLNAEDRRRVEQAAEVEMPIYEYAKKRFAAQVAAYPGDLERDLADFHAENARYVASQQRVDQLKAPFVSMRRILGRARRALKG